MPDRLLEPDDVELRRAARERALELLYEAEIKHLDLEILLAGLAVEPDALALELVHGVEADRTRIDDLLQGRIAPNWSLERLAAVDRAVLRLATYELLEATHRSEAIILNEAVVLARRFGTDDSGRFVNGVLSALAVEVRGGGSPRPGVPERERLVDAVVTDLDGVIRHWDDDAVVAGDEALGLPAGTLAAAAFERGRLERSMRGTITAEEWYAEAGAAVARAYPVEAAEAAEIMAHIGWRIDETVMELLDEVRRQVPVVLLSNASTRLEDDLRLSGIYDRFDAVVGSAELGVIKPEPTAYVKAAEAAGVEPARCLMIDDRSENVDGAEAVGMRAVRFTDADALGNELEALGLLLPEA